MELSYYAEEFLTTHRYTHNEDMPQSVEAYLVDSPSSSSVQSRVTSADKKEQNKLAARKSREKKRLEESKRIQEQAQTEKQHSALNEKLKKLQELKSELEKFINDNMVYQLDDLTPSFDKTEKLDFIFQNDEIQEIDLSLNVPNDEFFGTTETINQTEVQYSVEAVDQSMNTNFFTYDLPSFQYNLAPVKFVNQLTYEPNMDINLDCTIPQPTSQDMYMQDDATNSDVTNETGIYSTIDELAVPENINVCTVTDSMKQFSTDQSGDSNQEMFAQSLQDLLDVSWKKLKRSTSFNEVHINSQLSQIDLSQDDTLLINSIPSSYFDTIFQTSYILNS